MHNKRTIVFTAIIVLCIFVFNQCTNNATEKKAPIINANGKEYAGSEACRTCHQEIYDSFTTTVHHLTSGLASKDYIKGSFEKNEHTFVYNDSMKVVMEERDGGMFQVAYLNNKEVEAHRFDIVIGSGKKGQTYIYKRGNELFQLPVSYFAGVNRWANSPGYPDEKILFTRNIETRCLECHTTVTTDNQGFEFAEKQIMYGVDCERCHGPAAEHVEFHVENPNVKLARFITNPASLSRQQSLDVCALCHSGVMQSMKPAFSFVPGDTLSKFFIKNSSGIDSFKLDVHANQYGLLTASKCFRISGTMTCSSCHNTHNKENGNLVTYAQKCMTCHKEIKHNTGTLQDESPAYMMANCINCHMPVGASKNLTLLVSGDAAPSPELVRSHLIGIYEAEKIKERFQKNDEYSFH